MRVTIDPARCQGHTLCNMAAPEVFGLREDDGHAYVLLTEFDDATIASARRAASTCPEQAIVVED